MRTVKLGNEVLNAVGMGFMGLSHAYGAPTEKNKAIETIRAAYDMGYQMFDTAECYIGTNPDGLTSYNEELVGTALKDVRDKVFIAAKFGVTHTAEGLAMDSSPQRIRKSVEGSLEKLGTDHIDLKVEPEVVADVMQELINEGKIRYWGISETTEEYLRRADKVCHVSAIQNRYSMMAREHEPIFPVREELGVTYVTFSTMANGFLSSACKPSDQFDNRTDFRAHMPRYTEKGFAKAQELMELLEKFAEEKKVTKGQISLASMICKKPYILPIPGSRKVERLQENFNAGNVELSEEEVALIDQKFDGMDFRTYGKR